MSRKTWDKIAAEYSDEYLHPRMSCLRSISKQMIEARLRTHHLTSDSITLNAGSGNNSSYVGLNGHVINLDWSIKMMRAGSERPSSLSVIADATKMPLRSASVDSVLISLGAPFNVQEFWREVDRVLSFGGFLLYTTPSYEWSLQDRQSEFPPSEILDTARWDTQTGQLRFDSIVMTRERQVKIIESAGMKVESIHSERKANQLRERETLNYDCEVTLYDCVKEL